jgi:hypothetical protein
MKARESKGYPNKQLVERCININATKIVIGCGLALDDDKANGGRDD